MATQIQTQALQLPVTSSTLSSKRSICHRSPHSKRSLVFSCNATLNHYHHQLRLRRPVRRIHVGIEDTEPLFEDGDNNAVTTTAVQEDEQVDPTPEDLEYISQIQGVLELLRKNRDMLFGEVKLTISIEDPRELERRRLLGIDDSDGPSRDDLVVALEEVNEGKTPRNRVALRMLAEEMTSWPNLEVEATKTKGKNKSLYAKATDTGIDPEVAAKRLKVDWDSAAEIEGGEITNDNEVPSAVGYGALYLVTAFPVIIGVSVVLILFYNSLQ